MHHPHRPRTSLIVNHALASYCQKWLTDTMLNENPLFLRSRLNTDSARQVEFTERVITHRHRTHAMADGCPNCRESAQ